MVGRSLDITVEKPIGKIQFSLKRKFDSKLKIIGVQDT